MSCLKVKNIIVVKKEAKQVYLCYDKLKLIKYIEKYGDVDKLLVDYIFLTLFYGNDYIPKALGILPFETFKYYLTYRIKNNISNYLINYNNNKFDLDLGLLLIVVQFNVIDKGLKYDYTLYHEYFKSILHILDMYIYSKSGDYTFIPKLSTRMLTSEHFNTFIVEHNLKTNFYSLSPPKRLINHVHPFSPELFTCCILPESSYEKYVPKYFIDELKIKLKEYRKVDNTFELINCNDYEIIKSFECSTTKNRVKDELIIIF